MKRILEIDLDNSRVCVEPGVTNANVSAAVGPGFFYPPDPSSQIVCSIGGNVAENSGGAHCFKYGFTTNYVTGLELVLADGELVQIGGKELDPPRLRPARRVRRLRGHARRRDQDLAARRARRRRRVKTLVAFFDSTRDAGEAVSEIVQGGVVPGAIEMMDERAIEASEQMAQGGLHDRPRGRAAGRARRRRARVRGALRRGRRDLRALRLRRRARGPRRGRARALLEGAQGRVPGDGPDLAPTTSSRTA